jgi:hypothetical protein
MKFKPGDKVRFLNSIGGGTVVKEINAFMVSVAIEDGFEIPTLINELVAIEPAGASGDLFLNKNERRSEIPVKTVPEPESEIPETDRISRIVQRGSGTTAPTGVYLAWVPQDQQNLLSGYMDVYLVNNTSSEILYSFFLKNSEGNFSGTDFGSIPPESKLVIESIVRDDVGMFSNGVVQVLFFSEENEKVLMPVSATFRIKGSVFYQEGSYHETRFLANQKAVVYTVCELNRVPSTYEHILNEKENREPLPAAAERFRPEMAIEKHRIAPGEAEVDLHISALREDYGSLSPHEILTIQLGYFERMLGSAIAFSFTRVVFIHGIGNGSLKQAIINSLTEYEDVEFRSASFAKYGNGAIELIIHRNK